MKQYILAMGVLSLSFLSVSYQSVAEEVFNTGPVFDNFGKHAKVEVDEKLASDTKFKVAFDVSQFSGEKTLNRHFDSLARFTNMLVANGIAKENIQLALVVHGKATKDLLNPAAYQKAFAGENPNLPLVNALLKNNVQIFLCGQSAAANAVSNEDLIDGVQMSLSAMTANALLSQQGYTHNPF